MPAQATKAGVLNFGFSKPLFFRSVLPSLINSSLGFRKEGIIGKLEKNLFTLISEKHSTFWFLDCREPSARASVSLVGWSSDTAVGLGLEHPSERQLPHQCPLCEQHLELWPKEFCVAGEVAAATAVFQDNCRDTKGSTLATLSAARASYWLMGHCVFISNDFLFHFWKFGLKLTCALPELRCI